MFILKESEESNPTMFWFHNTETGKNSTAFFMGEISEKHEFLTSLGLEVKG